MNCHISPPSGGDLRSNIEGLLKKFRVTKENEKESEIFTLANLDNGCIRKFIVKKVDESAFLASINQRQKDDSKSLTDENENTAVVDSNDEDDDDLPDAHDGLALVGKSKSKSKRKKEREAEHKDPGSPSDAGGGGGEDDLDTRLQNQQNLERNHKNHKDEERNHSDAKKALENHSGLVANGKVKTGRFRLGCDDSDDDKDDIMPGEDKIDDDNDDPGVVNPTFFNDDEDDEGGRGDATSSVSTRSSPEPSPLHSPRLSFRMSPQPSPRHSPVSHRSGNLSQRSSVSSVRKGILKKSPSSTTINMEMVNLGLQQNAAANAAAAAAATGANAAAALNGYHRTRFSDPYDDSYVPMDTHRFVSSPDGPIGMTQKSLGGHRVKFILETGKPDHVTGSYDDIRIEKMERERLERIERGKNLEVTHNEGDKGGRKCLLFCAAILVLTGSVIAAGMYGSRRGNHDSDVQGASGLSGKESTPAGAQPTQDKFFFPNAIESQFKISNRNYSLDLAASSSETYKTFAQALEQELKSILLTNDISFNGKANMMLKVIKFESGSVLVTFRIAWKYINELEASHQDPPVNITTVKNKLEEQIKTGYLDNNQTFSVPLESVHVDNVLDECRSNTTRCSDTCKFSYDTLKFSCSCPDTLTLINNTHCGTPPKPAESPHPFLPPGVKSIISSKNASLISITPEYVSKVESPSANQTSTSLEGGDGATNQTKVDGGSEDAATNQTKTAVAVTEVPTNQTSSEGPPVEAPTNQTTTAGDKEGSKDATPPVEGNATSAATTTSAPTSAGVTVPASSTTAAPPASTASTAASEQEGGQAGAGEASSEGSAATSEEEAKPASEAADTSDTDDEVHSQEPVAAAPVPDEGEADTAESQQPSEEDASAGSDLADAGAAVEETEPQTEDRSSGVIPQKYPDGDNPGMHISPGTRFEDIGLFTNATQRAPPVLNMSSVREGDSPGDVRVQEPQPEGVAHSEPAATSSVATTAVAAEASTTASPAGEVVEAPVASADGESPAGAQAAAKTEKPVVIVTANETNVDAARDAAAEGDLNKDVVIVQATSYEEVPLPEWTTPAHVSTTPSPPPAATAATVKPPEVQVNRTSETVIINTEVNVQEENGSHGAEAAAGKRPGALGEATHDIPVDLGTLAHEGTGLGADASLGNRPPHPTSTSSTEATAAAPQTESQAPAAGAAAANTTSAAEPPPSICGEDEFQCVSGSSPSGVCIPKLSRCNSVRDCSDGSDEEGCFENQCFGNFMCADRECLERRFVCDGVNDCRDDSDETSCDSWACRADEFRCGGGGRGGSAPTPCIPESLRCDGQPDCSDHSDELNCTDNCTSDFFRCPEGWCLPLARTCDGRPDCYAGEDEQKCGCAALDETPCHVGGCVPTFFLCDGLRQCQDGSDEWHCLRIDSATRQLEVRNGESQWSAVCSEGWTTQWSDLVCAQLGSNVSVNTNLLRVVEPQGRPRVRLAPNASPLAHTPLQFVLNMECRSSDKLVHLECEHHACGSWGERKGREGREEAQWPSLALLQRRGAGNGTLPGAHACTASIVAPTWVLAAYSCLSGKPNGLNAATWELVTGQSTQNDRQHRQILRLVHFPGTVRTGGLWTGDAVLLKLDAPLVLDRAAQQVCVPHEMPETNHTCVVAGWTRNEAGRSQFLHHLPVPTLALDACNSTHYLGRLNNAHTCVGFSDAQYTPCHGDEGSPLMCFVGGVWRLEGLFSHHARCDPARHPAVFTALHALQPWLSNTIGIPERPAEAPPATTSAPTTTSTTTTQSPANVVAATDPSSSSSSSSSSASSSSPSSSSSSSSSSTANATNADEIFLSSPGNAPVEIT